LKFTRGCSTAAVEPKARSYPICVPAAIGAERRATGGDFVLCEMMALNYHDAISILQR
jgi:hypothetical protein